MGSNKYLIHAVENRKGEKIIQEAMEFYKTLHGKREMETDYERAETMEEDGDEGEGDVPEVLAAEVSKVMNKLKVEKAQGPDRISNKILRDFSDELERPLTITFNKILREGITPRQWDLVEIILLFKKGDKSQISIYRPISLAPCTSEIFMKIIKDRIYRQLDNNQA